MYVHVQVHKWQNIVLWDIFVGVNLMKGPRWPSEIIF